MARKGRATPYSGQETPEAAPSARADPPERILARLRPHGRVLVLPSLLLIAIAGAVGYLSGVVEAGWQTATLYGAGLAAVVLLWLLPTLAWLGHRYVITTRRLVLRRGLVVRVRQELLHSRGYDVSVTRGPLQTVFRSGDVRINTGLDSPVMLRDVPTPHLVAAALQDLMEASANPMAARRQQYESRPGSASEETQAYGHR